MPTITNYLGTGNSPATAVASLGQLNSSSNALTATGSSQGTALAVPTDFCVFTTVAASTGAILPASSTQVNPTDVYYVVNHGANALSIYPPTGGKIANGSANAAFSVAANKMATFVSLGSGNWAASVSA